MTATPTRRRAARLIGRWAWPLSLAIAAPVAQAAAYAPGSEADPPTGDTAPPAVASATEPLRGNGIDWRFGPWRTNGTLALDLRWLRFEQGASARQAAVLADIETASYLWQPWFAQVRLGVGFIASSDSNGHEGEPRVAATGNTLTGSAQLAVFPASRFPFTLRAEATDSRTNIESLGNDLQTRRLSLSQSYRPENGNDHYQLQVDVSHLLADNERDTLATVDGDAVWLRGAHRFELGGNWADNHSGNDRERTRLALLTGRHGFHPTDALGIDSLASWHDSRTRYRDDVFSLDFGSEVRQLSTLLTWRPREDDLPFAVPPNTLVVGSARWVEARTLGSFSGPTLASVSATLGASTDLTAAWRVAGAVSVNQFDAGDSAQTRNASLNASANWTPRSWALGEWRYAPTLGLNAGLTRGDEASDREFAAVQLGHSASRDFVRSESDRVSLSASQSVGWLLDATALESHRTTTLTHSLGLVWQTVSDASQQRFASASISDYRSGNEDDANFQLVNLQWSQRTQLSRLSSWSGSLTWQASRSQQSQVDLLSGERFTQGDGWAHFASGSVSAEHQRVFGVPRLRFTLLAGISTQQLQRRSAGDIDAPLRYVSRSIEARLDYAIGKLEARLSARAARVDERNLASVIARLQRRF